MIPSIFALKNTLDRTSIYLIEAARFSHFICEESFDDLLRALRDYEKKRDNLTALYITRNAWQFIDSGFRFVRLLEQIRGLKHKDPRFKSCEQAVKKIEPFRNFFQHLNSSIPQIKSDTNPMLGAVSWSAEDLKTTFVAALGTLPPGTQVHSLGFDQDLGNFGGDVVIEADNSSLNISQTRADLLKGYDYLHDWLIAGGHVDQKACDPFFISFPAPNHRISGMRWIRVHFNTGPAGSSPSVNP